MKRVLKAHRAALCLLVGFMSLVCFFVSRPILTAEDKVYISDLSTSIKRKHTFEDKLGLDKSYDQVSPLNIKGIQYNKGIGFHCTEDENAYVEFDLSETTYKKFAAYVGIQWKTNDNTFLEWGTINFIVKVDGRIVAESGKRQYGEDPYFLIADVSGGSVLRLEMDCCDSIACDLGAWGDAYLTTADVSIPIVTPTPTVTQNPEMIGRDPLYLSDMVWKSCYGYSDEETDEPVYRDSDIRYNDIFINDKYYEKGLGMHATGGLEAHVEIGLEGLSYKSFVSYIGVPSDTTFDNSMASIDFIVYLDGEEAYRSGIMHLGDEQKWIQLDISQAKTLRLVLLPGDDGISGDCGIWAMAALTNKTDIEDIFATPVPTPTPERSPSLKPSATNQVKPSATSVPETPGQFPVVPIVVVSVVVVVLCAAGFLIFYFRKKKK